MSPCWVNEGRREISKRLMDNARQNQSNDCSSSRHMSIVGRTEWMNWVRNKSNYQNLRTSIWFLSRQRYFDSNREKNWLQSSTISCLENFFFSLLRSVYFRSIRISALFLLVFFSLSSTLWQHALLGILMWCRGIFSICHQGKNDRLYSHFFRSIDKDEYHQQRGESGDYSRQSTSSDHQWRMESTNNCWRTERPSNSAVERCNTGLLRTTLGEGWDCSSW